MKGISRLLNKKCKRFKHHIRNILQNDIANKYIGGGRGGGGAAGGGGRGRGGGGGEKKHK